MSTPAESPDRASCRLFFGLCPPAATRRQIADFLHANPAPAKAVPPQNWHVTVLFVGEVDPGVCCRLKQLVLPDLPPAFMLRLERCGWWPRPQVGWLAPSQPPGPLMQLHAITQRAVLALGLALEKRPYRPHLTVWRKLAQPWHCARPPCIKWPVSELHLMRSFLSLDGPPQYRSLASWPLTTGHKS